MRRADVAMYLAKAEHAGIARYDVRRDQYDAATLGLVAELRHAIDSDQLVLHYQPQRDLATGRTTAIEALVRWQHPTRGLLYPDTFLPFAEQTDLIDQLARWVLRRALTDLQQLGEPGAELSVAVNVSARGIGRGELANDVIEILREVAIDPRRLVIEVTETTILADPARAAIVHSVIDLGHNLGLRVVAEGVETGEALAHLSLRGCDLVQGYLLSRPVPLDSLVDWLAAERTAGRTAGRGAPTAGPDARTAGPVTA